MSSLTKQVILLATYSKENKLQRVQLAKAQHQIERQQDVMRVALEALQGCYGQTTRDGVKRTRAIQLLLGELPSDETISSTPESSFQPTS